MTLRDLLDAVAKAEAAGEKLRLLLLQGNPRQIVRQLKALEAMTAKEHEVENAKGSLN